MELTSGGFQGGIVISWALLAPVGALMYKTVKEAAICMIMLAIAILAIVLFNSHLSPHYFPISQTAQSMFDGMNILGPGIIIYFSMQFYVKSVVHDGRLLQENNQILTGTLGELTEEKQKSDNLLLNILPYEVAEELKMKGSTTARYYDNVTILFTDFVNFTNTSERLSPQELIDELNICFKAFDEITGKYKIEKIKTIGDAYLAVCGLPLSDPNHAENVINAAIEICNFMSNRKALVGINTFNIRVGINSGNVVTGIVGVKKFAYDVWGDTVNTAARMEQNCDPGRINISEATHTLVKDKFNFEYRGEIEAKGKGMMKMYYVNHD